MAKETTATPCSERMFDNMTSAKRHVIAHQNEVRAVGARAEHKSKPLSKKPKHVKAPGKYIPEARTEVFEVECRIVPRYGPVVEVTASLPPAQGLTSAVFAGLSLRDGVVVLKQGTAGNEKLLETAMRSVDPHELVKLGETLRHPLNRGGAAIECSATAVREYTSFCAQCTKRNMPLGTVVASTSTCITKRRVPVGVGIELPVLLEIAGLCVSGPKIGDAHRETLQDGVDRIEHDSVTTSDSRVLKAMFPTIELILLDVSSLAFFTPLTRHTSLITLASLYAMYTMHAKQALLF